MFEAIKAKRTADALRYAGARMSTVGRRVVPSGRRVRLGSPVPILDAAMRALRQERRQDFGSMAAVQEAWHDELAARPHWSEVPA